MEPLYFKDSKINTAITRLIAGMGDAGSAMRDIITFGRRLSGVAHLLPEKSGLPVSYAIWKSHRFTISFAPISAAGRQTYSLAYDMEGNPLFFAEHAKKKLFSMPLLKYDVYRNYYTPVIGNIPWFLHTTGFSFSKKN